MRTKPKEGETLVYKVRQLWRGIFRVEWTDSLNYPRTFETLFRKVNGAWCSGEAHPVGVHNGGLIRAAHPSIASALNGVTRHE